MDKYSYDGPVVIFDKCISDNWHAETYADTVQKARNNIKYQFKKQNNMAVATKITMPGTFIRMD